jgi:F0F1-type ATP synthase membrane subunit b/b'
MEIHDVLNAMQEGLERMSAAAALMERTAELMAQAGEAQKIVATADSERELELERKLEAAEQQIAELRAQGAQMTEHASAARKTLPAATTQLLAKQGLTTLDSIDAGAVDAALVGLSLEQRIAVKAQLLRAGLVS